MPVPEQSEAREMGTYFAPPFPGLGVVDRGRAHAPSQPTGQQPPRNVPGGGRHIDGVAIGAACIGGRCPGQGVPTPIRTRCRVAL